MSDLSFPAQSILDAFLKTPGEQPMPNWDYQPNIAAVLRTAALYCKRDRLILLCLADEFENIKYGTYRCELPLKDETELL